MKNVITYFLLFSLVLSACDRDELLDIKPYGKKLPTTVDDFRLMMDHKSSPGNDVGRVPMYNIDLLMSDDIKIPDGTSAEWIGNNSRQYDALFWSEDFGAPNDPDKDWNALYNQIYMPNLIIEYLQDPDITGDDQLRAQLIAEGKVHRAMARFALVNLYSKQYNSATAATDLGIPLKLTTATGPDAKNPRATVQEVYDVILKDLTEALDSEELADKAPAGINWRASKAGAYATLAKVYLQMGDYTNALTAADNCLGIYNTLTDLNPLTTMPEGWKNKEIIMLKTSRRDFYNSTAYVSDELLGMYNENDLRPGLRFPRYNDEYIFTRKGSRERNSYIGPSVGEMYLIRAECNARAGNYDLVIEDLNTLLVTRYATGTYNPLSETEINAATALAFVKEERRKELAWQGVRLFDLKRYNAEAAKGEGNSIDIVRVVDGKEYTLKANSNRWIVPIARSVMRLSPEIEQSPR